MTSEMMPGCPHCGCQLLTHACPGPDGFANTRPAPALSEIVAAAEAWVSAALWRSSDQFCSVEDINDADENLTTARARFLALVAAHAAEVAKVLEPFVRLHKERADIYRKRGGNPDAFPDTHPAYDITARELPSGVWRAAADLRRRVTAAPHEKREG